MQPRVPLFLTLAALATLAGCSDAESDAGGAAPTTAGSGVTSTATADATSTSPASGTAASSGTGAIPGWTELPALPGGPRQETAVVARGDRVFVLGGFDEDGVVVADVEIFDAASGTWSAGPPLPTTMHHANAAVAGGTIYVLGFLEGVGFGAREDCYALHDGGADWSLCMAMPTAERRGAATVGVVGDEIFVVGGFRGQAVAEASVFDAGSDTWSPLPPLPTPTDHLVGGVVDGRFFAIGGRDTSITSQTSVVLELAPDRESWIPRASMPTARGGAAAAVMGGSIYVFGGEGNPDDASGVFPVVEAYDVAADAWRTLDPMRTPRHGTGAAAVPQGIVVPGGADRQAFAAVDTVELFVP